MMSDLESLAQIVGGRLHGRNAKFNAVSTDSRSVNFNSLFVALEGEHFNGNDFVINAQESGAAGALVSELQADALIDQVVVADTLKALQTFAAHWRRQFDIPVVGITGSNGKTTTKTMLKEILSQSYYVHATRGNLNNEIGVPVTLLGLKKDHQYAIVEMGANHRAEIGQLAKLAQPRIGIITNTSAAHLQGFNNLEGVVRAKGELFQALPKNGVAIINAESKGSAFLSKLAKHCEQLSFGFLDSADVQVSDIRSVQTDTGIKQVFNMSTPSWRSEIEMSLLGAHNALNAAAAAAAAFALGVRRDDVVLGLNLTQAVEGRFNAHELGIGGWLIDDCYNANPASMRAAIDTAMQLGYPVWFVMGDMFEMGDGADAHHAHIGEYAKQAGVERLYAAGQHSKAAAEAFGMGSGDAVGAQWFETGEQLSMTLNQAMAADSSPVTVVVKASRGMRFEKIVKELNKHFIEATGKFRTLSSHDLENQ